MEPLTREVLRQKRDLFDTIRTKRPKPDVFSREGFKEYLVVVFVDAGLNDRELADDMAYNVTSVRRWLSSDSCPHRALWPQIVSWIDDKLSALIAQLDIRLAVADAGNEIRGGDKVVSLDSVRRKEERAPERTPVSLRLSLAAGGQAAQIDLTHGGSVGVEFEEEKGPREAKMRFRRIDNALMVRREGGRGELLVREGPDSHIPLAEGAWVAVETDTWVLTPGVIKSLFSWSGAPSATM